MRGFFGEKNESLTKNESPVFQEKPLYGGNHIECRSSVSLPSSAVNVTENHDIYGREINEGKEGIYCAIYNFSFTAVS